MTPKDPATMSSSLADLQQSPDTSRRFSLTAQDIDSLPVPQYEKAHTCSICTELYMHADESARAKEVYNNPMERYRTSALLDAAREGCCISTVALQAAAGFVKNGMPKSLSIVKTVPDEQFRFAVYTGEPDTIAEIYEQPGLFLFKSHLYCPKGKVQQLIRGCGC